jgi:hypothetical protein
MRIKQECIGQSFRAKAPNGVEISGVIEDNPSEFKTYKILGLDVFDNNPKTEVKANVIEVEPKVSGKNRPKKK